MIKILASFRGEIQMKWFFRVLGYLFGLIFLLFSVLGFWAQHWLPSVLVLVAFCLVFPPVRRLIGSRTGIRIHPWLRGISVPLLFILFLFILMSTMGHPDSIYKNDEIRAGLMKIYDAKMKQWPDPHQVLEIDTRYGRVHVIVNGPEDAPAILLLHASAMGSWSWVRNVGALSQFYRTYAIDTIGDAGRSELRDANVYPDSGKELADFYQALMDSLGVQSASVIGASQGGFIATNLALYAPHRVEKLIPCGPMGYTGTNLTVLKIIFTTLFPVRPLQTDCTRWAFGDDPDLIEDVSDWFSLILNGVISRQAQPVPFTRDQFESIQAPVLLLLGTKDGLVGDPEKTRQVVQVIPDVRVEILETGHLIGYEKPEKFNRLLLEFLKVEDPSSRFRQYVPLNESTGDPDESLADR